MDRSATQQQFTFIKLLPTGSAGSGDGGGGAYTALAFDERLVAPGRTRAETNRPFMWFLGDLAWLVAMFFLSLAVLVLLQVGQTSYGYIGSGQVIAALTVLSGVSVALAVWRSARLYQQSLDADDPGALTRRFSDVMSVYAINVVAFSLLFTLAAAFDVESISHTDPRSSGLTVFLDSVYDVTLVASGIGYGERVPKGPFPKLVMFLCSAYLTIGMSMTVFARVLSSSMMYMHRRKGSSETPTSLLSNV